MKRGINVKTFRINARFIVELIIYFFMGRVSFLSISPVPLSVFSIALAEKRKKNPDILCIFAGMFTKCLMPFSAVQGGNLVKYGLIFFTVLTVDRLLYKRKIFLGRMGITYLVAAVAVFIGICGGIFDSYENVVLSLCEGILVIVCATLLYYGMHLIRYGKIGQALTNEQLISVVLMMTFFVNGLYEPAPDIISVREGIMFMLILYMSYKYGAQAGAIIGAAAGVSAGAYGEGASLIGMYCIVGIATGIVKEAGKWASIVVFVISGAAVGFIYPDELWSPEELKTLLSAAAGFIFIPKSILSLDTGGEDAAGELVYNNVKNEVSTRLLEFSDAFNHLGDVFAKNKQTKEVISRNSTREIVGNLVSGVCSTCENASYCWEQKYYDTYHETHKMLCSAEGCGKIEYDDVSPDFAARCVHFNDFVQETNKQLELMRMSTLMVNRTKQNRMLLAEQMKEVSGLIEELEKEVTGIRKKEIREEAKLISILSSYGVKIKKLAIIEKPGGRTRICMKAKAAKGLCITTKEVSEIISGVLKNRWLAAEECGCIMPKDYKELVFVQDVNFYILTGVARVPKEGEELSGDNYSVLSLPTGKVVMTITDGMGTGSAAYDESETVIEMIEQLAGAGFSESMALRLVNSSLVFSREGEKFSTADMSVIDLNTGMCECIKCGGAVTFIKRKKGVETVRLSAMPVGILPEAEPESTVYKLRDGDMVVMISDGILDMAYGASAENVIKDIIEQETSSNPQEMAEHILSVAKNNSGRRAGDDMTVLVCGLWHKV